MRRSFAIPVLGLLLCAAPALALDLLGAVRESTGEPPAGAAVPCAPLSAQRNGNCGNYRWYNVCSGYIWIFSIGAAGDEVGTRFSATDGLTCITPGNVVKRAITYWRNVVPNYNQWVDVLLYSDSNGDGCPPFGTVATDLNMDPGLRWNCSNFGAPIPTGVHHLIVAGRTHGGTAPSFPTDGPFTQTCDPVGNDHSYYYGIGLTQCVPWRLLSPTGRGDNFLYHLIVDGPPTATQQTSWGSIKGLFQ